MMNYYKNLMKFAKKSKIVSKKNLITCTHWRRSNKAKLKSYNGKINSNFHKYKLAKEGFQFICLSVILIDSVFRTAKNYYPQAFLEECKYVVKQKKMAEYITDDIEISWEDPREEKAERQKKLRERYQNLTEEQKQKLLEYMINYYTTHNQ